MFSDDRAIKHKTTTLIKPSKTNNWFNKWNIKLNTDKSEYNIFKQSKIKDILKVNHTDTWKANKAVKYLAECFDFRLMCSHHVNNKQKL